MRTDLRTFTLCLALAATLCATPPASAQPGNASTRVAAMPLTEVPADRPGDTLVIFYSGDGGWAPIDKGVSAALAVSGASVVGVNSLRYFIAGRTADAAAADLAAVIETYGARWGRQRIILAGFSFGADALPAILPHLPLAARQRVRSLALISAGATGGLRIAPGGWLQQASADTYPLAPALLRSRGLPMICLYGDKDRNAGCPGFSADLIRPIRMTGDHHLNYAYGPIARAILASAP